MPTVRRTASAALSLVLLTGIVAPASADQTTRSNEPQVTASQESAAQAALRDAVEDARSTYRATITEARAVRDEALAAPRSERRKALRKADTRSERRAARRAYRKAAKPIKQEYRATRSAARAARKAAIQEAVADYLVATGDPEVVDALRQYRTAVETAGETLKLALASSRAVFRTDTADEREQLSADLELAETPDEVAQAWADFVAACAEERTAHATAVKAARATYASALAKARAELEDTTGMSKESLLRLPFTI